MTNQNKELEEILDSFHNKLLSAIPFDNDPTKEESNLIEDIWDISTKKLLAWRDKSVNEARVEMAKDILQHAHKLHAIHQCIPKNIVEEYIEPTNMQISAHLNKKGNSND